MIVMSEQPTETAKQEKTVRVNLHLKEPVHNKLRMWCLKNRYTLQQGLEEIVEAAMGVPK
jgi:hypothetical protein